MAISLKEILLRVVCPVCHHTLTQQGETGWVHCEGCGRYYPVQDSLPVLIASRAIFDTPNS